MLRDDRLIEALEALPQVPFEGIVWQIVREGRDPHHCSASGGRWDDGTFEVLYSSRERDGVLAELSFYLLRGQPVFPSRTRFTLHELRVSLGRSLALPTRESLSALGVETSRYGQLSYEERVQEYPRTQDIAEVAHFLDCDGIIVPSARWACTKVVIFCDGMTPHSIETIADHGVIDWAAWQKAHKPKV